MKLIAQRLSIIQKLKFRQGIAPNHQRLIFTRHDLEDDRSVVDYNIWKNVPFFLSFISQVICRSL